MPNPEREPASSHAIALGLLQGPTELLPVSSSAHTRLVPWLLGAPWPQGEDEARKAFEVALHLGAGAALAIDMRREVLDHARDADAGQWLALLLAIAPAMLAGGLLKGPIERRLGGPRSIAAGLLAGSVVMVWADARDADRREFAQVGPAAGLAVGLAQACALMPGVSRNGATLAAARMRGFSRSASQSLSWGVALPVILGAGALKAADIRHDTPAALSGGAAAFASTLLAARLLRRRGRRLAPYAAYRCLLAGLVLARLRRGP
jgi:undecaprenyl-diphosphatase